MFKHELGIEAKDLITGFKGIIIGRCEYLTGCTTYGLRPRELSKEGLMIECQWFDEDRIKKIGKGISLTVKTEGGPQESVPRSK